jgi:coenzyme F420-0:L-glutamate ligase/coenzyme F420-1:gamma-L-glutamate ligase
MSSNAKPGTSRQAVGSNKAETMDPLCCIGHCYVQPVSALQIFGIPGLPEIVEGTDLAALIASAARDGGAELADGDIVVVTSKVVSKAEGRTIELADVDPSPFAIEWSTKWDKDPGVIEVVLREAKRVVRQSGPVLITETQHGFVCANSGVDQSSSGAPGRLVLLPTDPDGSARGIRAGLAAQGVDAAVIISDTFGRAWREGQTDIAIGIAGMQPIHSYIGQLDPHGHEFKVQAVCLADELAGAAELVKGNISRTPVGVIRGLAWERDDTATIAPVLREQSRDLFR